MRSEYRQWLHDTRLVDRFLSRGNNLPREVIDNIFKRMVGTNYYNQGGWENAWGEIFLLAEQELSRNE